MNDNLKEKLNQILDETRTKDAEGIWETLKSAKVIADDVFLEEPSDAVVFKIYQFLRIEEGVRELGAKLGDESANKYKHYLRSTVGPLDPNTLN